MTNDSNPYQPLNTRDDAAAGVVFMQTLYFAAVTAALTTVAFAIAGCLGFVVFIYGVPQMLAWHHRRTRQLTPFHHSPRFTALAVEMFAGFAFAAFIGGCSSLAVFGLFGLNELVGLLLMYFVIGAGAAWGFEVGVAFYNEDQQRTIAERAVAATIGGTTSVAPIIAGAMGTAIRDRLSLWNSIDVGKQTGVASVAAWMFVMFLYSTLKAHAISSGVQKEPDSESDGL